MVYSVVARGVQALGTNFSGSGAMQDANRNYMTFNKFGNSYMKAAMVVAGGFSGGISSTIAGGKFVDGFKQGLITSGLNHVVHLGAAELDKWLTATMEISADKPQSGETDCVPTVGRAAGRYLGMDIDATGKQALANSSGGIRANKTKEFFESMGLNVDALYEGKAAGDYYFHNGIPSFLNKLAIKFIVESIQAGHPVYLGFTNSNMAGNNLGHAVLVTEIKYTADFSRMKSINYFDPATGRNSGQIVSFQNTYGMSETIYNIFSLSKP